MEPTKSVNGKCFDKMENFRNFAIDKLKKGYPILVESISYGGHYRIIIGHDKRSKKD